MPSAAERSSQRIKANSMRKSRDLWGCEVLFDFLLKHLNRRGGGWGSWESDGKGLSHGFGQS